MKWINNENENTGISIHCIQKNAVFVVERFFFTPLELESSDFIWITSPQGKMSYRILYRSGLKETSQKLFTTRN